MMLTRRRLLAVSAASLFGAADAAAQDWPQRPVRMIVPFGPGGRVISWLPAAHIAERMAHHYIPTIYAGTITCAPNPREVVSYLPQVRPTWFFAVPRIWEKLKA